MNLEDKTNKNIKQNQNNENEIIDEIVQSEMYALSLISNILPALSFIYSFDEFKDKGKIIKTKIFKFNIHSLSMNLSKNPYLSFEQKYMIFNSLEEKLKQHFYDNNDDMVICLYKLNKLNNTDNLNKSTITSFLKKNKFIRTIFAENFFIRLLYKEIYYLSKKYDRFNMENYIKHLGDFLLTSEELFSQYKLSYSMDDKNIKTLLKIITLFENQNYKTEIEEKFFKKNIKTLNRKNKYKFEKLYKQFILSDTKLIFFTLKILYLNHKMLIKILD